MPDREKVMYSLERCSSSVPDACRDCEYDKWPARICVQHLTKDALELLKEQEPVAAIAQDTPIPINDTTVRFFKRYLCGKCRAEITYNCKYCHNCGQAVKWDG